MKNNMIDDIEKLFNESDYPFVTITANGKTLGNYCTESYKDIDRLYTDMIRHNIPLDTIQLNEIEMATIPDKKELSKNIEKLNKELGDMRSHYHSTLVAKQAANYERLKLPKDKRR